MKLHTFEDMEQRSPEWYEARCGIVTASVVGKLLTFEPPSALEIKCSECGADPWLPCLSLARRKKGELPKSLKSPHAGRSAAASALPSVLKVADNDTARGVTASLVAERITGEVEPTFTSDDMWRGIEHEPYARDIYSGHYQQAVECGFMRLDGDGWSLGLSPDGLVADEGGIEVKCPRAKTHVRTILAGRVPASHVAQIQTALLVTSRAWWDFVSFHAGLPLFVKRVYPDPAWHEAIVAAVKQFETTAAEMVAAYEQATTDMPATERITELEMSL